MTREDILSKLVDVLHVLKPKLDLSAVGEESRLVLDLGIDSLSMMLMALAIEDAFKISFDATVSFTTVGDVVDYIGQAAK